MLTILAKCFGWVEKFITAVTAIMLIIISTIVTIQVFGRYVLHASPYWVEEMSGILMMWVGVFGAAGALWTDSYLSLRLFVRNLSEGAQVWLKFGVNLLIGIFAAYYIIYGSTLVTTLMVGSMATLDIPLGYTYMVVPASGVLLILFALVQGLERILDYYTKKGVATK